MAFSVFHFDVIVDSSDNLTIVGINSSTIFSMKETIMWVEILLEISVILSLFVGGCFNYSLFGILNISIVFIDSSFSRGLFKRLSFLFGFLDGVIIIPSELVVYF